MAKQPDDQNPQRKRDDKEHDTPHPIEHAEEVEEVLDAEEVVPQSYLLEETHTARPAPQPTRIAPYQADAADVAEPENIELAGMPNLSLDEPKKAVGDSARENVLEDEPVPAEIASGASSVVEVAEVIEEASDVHDVFADDEGQVPRSSSIIEVAELAEIVEDGSPEVVTEAQASPVTPPPPMGDDLFVSDVLDNQEDQETSSIFGKGAGGEAKPISTDSMAHDEEAIQEILSTESSGSRGPALPEEVVVEPDLKHAEAVEVADDTVDLGSDPDVHVDPSSPQRIKKDKTRAVPEEVTHATEEINWDDIIGDEESAAGDLVTKGEAKPLSGVDVDAGEQAGAVKKTEAKDEVTFDDVESELDEVPSSKKGEKAAKNGDEASVYAEDTDLDVSPLKQENEDVQFDEEEKAGEPDDAEEISAKALLDDDEAEKNFQEEAEPIVQKKKGKKAAEEEEGELVGAGKPAAKAAPKARSGRGVLVGTCLATVLLGGGAAAVWFAKPDLLEEAYKSSPNYTPPKKERPKVEPIAAQARARIDGRDFDQALDILKNADKTPLNLSTRAEARWLKYLQQAGAEKPLDKNAPEVKLVLADVDEAGNDLLKTQITRALDGGSSKGNEKDILDLQERVKKAEYAEKCFLEFQQALVKEKLLAGKDRLDPAAFQKVLKELSNTKTNLAAVNKLLEDAKIQDSGDKGVSRLLAAKKDVDDRLEAINKVLADTKFKDEGAKGLAEMIAAQGTLAKDRDELDQAIKAAYQELIGGGPVPPGDDPRAKIVEAVKIARQKAESPLAIPLNQLTSSLSGLGLGAGKAVEKSFDMAAVAAEVALVRLREPLLKLFEARPAVQQEVEAPRINPALAEQLFGKGVDLFWSRRYADAETQFKEAIQHHQDARFEYFLGMALMAQPSSSKRQAAYSAFEQGARLEASNRPSMGEINASMERIQGSMRTFVNTFRQKARAAAN